MYQIIYDPLIFKGDWVCLDGDKHDINIVNWGFVLPLMSIVSEPQKKKNFLNFLQNTYPKLYKQIKDKL